MTNIGTDEWRGRTELVSVSLVADVAVVTMTRPTKLNALSFEMRRDVAEAIRLFGDGGHAKGLVLTGSGRAFSAGEDLGPVQDDNSFDVGQAIELFNDITRAVLTTHVPTVAAINGLAVGGGFEMTLCFDARIAASSATISLPEAGLGLPISNGASLLLKQMLRRSDALRLVLESAPIQAHDAADLGLIDQVVVNGEAVSSAVSLIDRWTRSARSVTTHLRLLRPTLAEVESAFAAESEAAHALMSDVGDDAKYGTIDASEPLPR